MVSASKSFWENKKAKDLKNNMALLILKIMLQNSIELKAYTLAACLLLC